MATECDHCGFRTNEVKSGSGIEEKGTRHCLRILTPQDLARDVLKSETCDLEIPELELQVGSGIFVGKFVRYSLLEILMDKVIATILS